MGLHYSGKRCSDCSSSVRWLNHHCPKCRTDYCFTCACRENWRCPKCGNELI